MTTATGSAPDGRLRPGSVLGKFSIVREIGRGGMCFVYEARHRDLHKTAAVKTLKPEYAAQPEVIERFVREGRAASRVRHRHAIDMIDVGEHDGVVYLAMEYLEGEDLAGRIKRAGPLSARETVDTLLPVMAAIVEAHEAGVVHRDLKPANIFLSTDRRGNVEPKVLDFGISKVTLDDAQHQTATSALLGTPCYMAPEQVQGARYTSPASDQWSLGVIVFQCLTGALPFFGPSMFDTMQAIVFGRYTAPRAIVPSIPAELEAVIARALTLNPAQRFPSVAAMGEAMLPFASPGIGALWTPTFTSGARVASAPVPLPPGMSSNPGTITQATHEVSRPTQPSSSGLRYALVCVLGLALVAAAAMARRATRSTSPSSPVSASPRPATPPEAVALMPTLTQPTTPTSTPRAVAVPVPAAPTQPTTAVEPRPTTSSRARGRSRTSDRAAATERDRHGTLLIR